MPQQPEESMPGGASRWYPFAIAASVAILDRLTKQSVRSHLGPFDSISVFPGWFRLVHTENPGAAFGMLAEGGPVLRAVVLIGISAAVLGFVVHSLLKNQSWLHGTVSRVALGFILGGAFGNLYDRVAAGTVTDFLEVYYGGWTFPAFNVADSAITVGAALLLIDMVRSGRKPVTGHAVPPPSEF